MKDTIFIHEMKDPYEGADFEELQVEECPLCGNTIDECKCYSPCCGAPIVFGDLCSQCHEHI
jgi:hypothetical protein